MPHGARGIAPNPRKANPALLVVRLFRSLDPLVGADAQKRHDRLRSHNKALNGTPAALIETPTGLVNAPAYLGRWQRAGRRVTAPTAWNPGWVQEHTQPLAMHAFRMVETQHIAATMRLVDSAAEQDVLEQMLDASKPPLPL
ncbi:MAG: hypothetical protein R3E55_03490 [Burkholderiaceae bacterium]